MKKKLTSVVFILVLCVLVVCAFVGCRKTHAHDYGDWTITIEPTCETEGERIRSCSGCDITEIETLPALGHAYGEFVAEKSATCTENGVKAHFDCSVCHKLFDSEKNVIENLTIDATGHVYGDWIDEVSATCTENGAKGHYECSVCHKYFDNDKAEIEDLTIDALGHTYGDWIDEVSATCTEEGAKGHFECSTCHKYFDNDKAEIEDLTIDALGHTYGDWIDEVSATCTENGAKGHYECSVCHKYFDNDKAEIEDLTIKAGHTFGDWIKEIEATCTAEGTKGHYECSVCHKLFDADKNEIEDLTISALGHSFGTWNDEVKPTCTDSGVKGHYECSACHKYFDNEKNEIEDLTISALGHSYGTWIDEVEPTCTVEGTKGHFECTVCHKYFDTAKAEIESLTIAKIEHTYSEWHDEIKATCFAEGTKGYFECTVCYKYFDSDKNEIEGLTIPVTHNKVLIEVVKATCTQSGFADAYRCTLCRQMFDAEGNVITTIPTIDALGHTYGDWIDEFPATDTTDGVKAHKDCLVCGLHFDAEGNEIETLTIPALQHILSAWIIEVAETCTEDGTKGHYECEHCSLVFDKDYNVIEDVTIPASHNLVHYDRKEPTCESDGNVEYNHCTKCYTDFDNDMNEIDSVYLWSFGHSYGDWIDEVSATCTVNGVKGHKTCTRCNENFDQYNNKISSLVIKASHTFGDRTAEIPATCTTDGRFAYDYCSVCEKIFDVFGNEKSESELIISALGHDLGEWIKEFSATCTETGVIGHNHCNRCNKDFDADNLEIADTLIPAYGHVYTTETIIPQLDPTCEESGYVAHFECGECGTKVDENGNVIDVQNFTLSIKGHSYGLVVDRVNPTCTDHGMNDYIVCSRCSKFFKTPDYYTTLTEADLVLPALGHNYDHVDPFEATCSNNGAKEHYHCDRCDTFFNTEKVEVASDTVITPRLDHVFGARIDGTPATETENGCIAHYECEVCGHIVDENYKDVTTIVLPKLEHNFGDWHEKEDESCYRSGTKGYYFCYNCRKNFDKDYNEIENLEISPHHTYGELIEAKQGKCDEPDILISHYECSECGQMIDEQNNTLYYSEVFEYNYRHNYEFTDMGYLGHTKVCKDCGYRSLVSHNTVNVYYVEKGLHMCKEVCQDCGYERGSRRYNAIIETRVISDYYVGYTDDYSSILEVKYDDGGYSNWTLSSIADYSTLNELHNMLSSLPEDFTPFEKTFYFEEKDYKETVSITFRPFVINAVKTEFDYYQIGNISNISDIEFILDCNYTDALGEIITINGSVADIGDFDPNYDFEATGETLKVFTVKYDYEGKTYDVNITLCTNNLPKKIKIDKDVIMQGDSFKFNIVYTDNSLQSFVLTDADIIEGTFDSSLLGRQTFTIGKDGLVKKVSVDVLDPYGVNYFDVSNCEIFLGESIIINVNCNNGSYRSVTVTPEMIIGNFDNMTAGRYNISVYFEQCLINTEIIVRDPNDYRIEDIYLYNNSSVIWDIVDGAVVPDFFELYLNVHRYNGTEEIIRITEDMVSYKQSDVDNAIANTSSFEAVVTYYGKTTKLTVYPRDLQTYTERNFFVTKLGEILCSYSTLAMKNGDLRDYIVKIIYSNGYRYISLTKDMIFTDEDGTIPFDFDSMENEKRYTVYVRYNGNSGRFDLIQYSDTDAKYYVTCDTSISATVGTRESVIESLKDRKWSFYMEIGYGSIFIRDIGINDVVLDESDNIDFSKPGNIELKAWYNGALFTINIKLIESLEGVEKTTYRYEDEDFDFYANGTVYVEYYDEWGTIVCINQELGIYRAVIDQHSAKIFKIEGNVVSEYTAEMLGGIEEIYTIETPNGTNTYKVYTKNAFSLADMYDDYDYYDGTSFVEFSLDGKYIYIDYVRYTIKADNKLELEEEGNIVYAYYIQEGVDAARLHYNDNGIVYMYFIVLDSDGNVLQEVLSETFTWIESNGNVYTYDGADLLLKGKVVDGELIIDTDF